MEENKLKTGCWNETEQRMYGKETTHYWYRYANCPQCKHAVHTGALFYEFRGRTQIAEFTPPGRNYKPEPNSNCLIM